MSCLLDKKPFPVLRTRLSRALSRLWATLKTLGNSVMPAVIPGPTDNRDHCPPSFRCRAIASFLLAEKARHEDRIVSRLCATWYLSRRKHQCDVMLHLPRALANSNRLRSKNCRSISLAAGRLLRNAAEHGGLDIGELKAILRQSLFARYDSSTELVDVANNLLQSHGRR